MKGELSMLQDNFLEVYDKFKLEFFRRIFELVREREGSLTAMEAFSIEIIHALNEPTIGRFAEFLNISQSALQMLKRRRSSAFRSTRIS